MGPPHSVPRKGEDAYVFKEDRENCIGIGSIYRAFKATRIFDNCTFCIKVSARKLDIMSKLE